MADPKNPQPSASPGDGLSDLPAEVIRRIDSMYERLTTLDYYTLLGIGRSATRAQVRQAFLAQAPQYHPDKYFGRKLGPYAGKMERVFAELSVAHDTLVNDQRRAEYNETLAPEPPPVTPPAPAPEAKDKSASPVDFTETPTLPPRSPSEMSPAVARARQQAFAAKLAGHSSARMRSGTPVAAFVPLRTPTPTLRPGEGPRHTSSAVMPAVDPKAAVDALKRRYEESVAHARGRQSQDLVHAAEAATAKGDFREAARLYRAATEHSSTGSMRAVLADAETKAKLQEHSAMTQRAKDAEQKQDYADAANSWARAFELVPNAETAHRASLCFRRGGGDPRRAAKHGEDAVKLDPNRASYRVNLALVYADLGLTLRARGEIERAQALDPQSGQVKEALVRIKAMK
jgi:DnaJ-like protein